VFNVDAEIGTPVGDELDVLMTLLAAYEAKHYAMPPSDPVDPSSLFNGCPDLSALPS
jgi:antitoxin component HigA of HigAB toxin-antitoxin module